MYDFFAQSVAIKKGVIETAASKMHTTSIIIEKDLWVTLALNALFSKELPPIFLFKGGTSLSKAYQIIERFSEDIDIIIDRGYFSGEISTAELKHLSPKQRDKKVEKLKEKASHYINTICLVPLCDGVGLF